MDRIGIMTPPWLSDILTNPDVTDICLNGSHSVFLDQGMGMERFAVESGQEFQEESLKEWILFQLSQVGKTWDAKHPFVDATLTSGHRLHVVFPPLARQGILISLRRLPGAGSSLGGGFRWARSPLYSVLRAVVQRGDSLLISGATGSGKTTLISDLLDEVTPQERIIALEDTPELNPAHPHFLSLLSRPPNPDGYGEVTLRTLLKQTLRMRPDRIILGECRGPEVLELLQALNTGHKGALATLHANTPRDALRRIELLCLLSSGGSLSSTSIRELLSLGIQYIAQVKRENALRRISEVWKIEGREGDTILMRPVLQSE